MVNGPRKEFLTHPTTPDISYHTWVDREVLATPRKSDFRAGGQGGNGAWLAEMVFNLFIPQCEVVLYILTRGKSMFISLVVKISHREAVIACKSSHNSRGIVDIANSHLVRSSFKNLVLLSLLIRSCHQSHWALLMSTTSR